MTEAPPTVQDATGIDPANIPDPPAEWTRNLGNTPAYGFSLPDQPGKLFVWQYKITLTNGDKITAYSSYNLCGAERVPTSKDAEMMITCIEGQVMIHFDKDHIRYDHILKYERYVRRVDEYQAKALV